MTLAFVEPRRPWRWGVLPVLGQFLWMLLWQGPGNLLPLGIIVCGLLALPPIFAASVGAKLGNEKAQREEP